MMANISNIEEWWFRQCLYENWTTDGQRKITCTLWQRMVAAILLSCFNKIYTYFSFLSLSNPSREPTKMRQSWAMSKYQRRQVFDSEFVCPPIFAHKQTHFICSQWLIKLYCCFFFFFLFFFICKCYLTIFTLFSLKNKIHIYSYTSRYTY